MGLAIYSLTVNFFIQTHIILYVEFDSGSERTLAVCLTHASRTRKPFGVSKVAHGCVTRNQPAL